MVPWKGLLLLAFLICLICEGDSWVRFGGRRRRQCSPVHCRVSSWVWSRCTEPCGSGKQEGSRRITHHPSCGGGACPSLRTTRLCNTQCCVKNCEVSAWKDWTKCSSSCGTTGHQSRARSVKVKESCGGTCNEVLHEKRACNRNCCPVNCELGVWGNWTTCSATCGTHGGQLRSRDVLVPASCEGVCDSATEETRSCNRKCCPKECLVSLWSDWGECSASCGKDGTRVRQRQVLQAASCNGTCLPLTETGECNRHCCPKNCKVSAWTNYTKCSATCGESVKRRSRVVSEIESCGGECKDHLSETTKCNVPCCRQDCAVGLWSTWDLCSSTCGSNGTQVRSRSKTTVEKCNGTCSFGLKEARSCNRVCCPIHCEMRWGPWSHCMCDGVERRYGIVVKEHKCNGRPCPGTLTEKRKCQVATKCSKGVCGDAGKCHCQAGYFGVSCSKPCPLGLYGKKCTNLCESCPQRSCSHVTGQCTCPILTYGPKCEHRMTCGTGYHCTSAEKLHSSYAQCYIRSTTRSNHVTCPVTHHLNRCHCYNGCHPKTIISSRLCHCECHPPSFFFWRRHYAAALCCPKNQYKPQKQPIEMPP